MFYRATSFWQDLCAWCPQLDPSVKVGIMFYGMGCPMTSDPNLTASPLGPFCYVCS